MPQLGRKGHGCIVGFRASLFLFPYFSYFRTISHNLEIIHTFTYSGAANRMKLFSTEALTADSIFYPKHMISRIYAKTLIFGKK